MRDKVRLDNAHPKLYGTLRHPVWYAFQDAYGTNHLGESFDSIHDDSVMLIVAPSEPTLVSRSVAKSVLRYANQTRSQYVLVYMWGAALFYFPPSELINIVEVSSGSTSLKHASTYGTSSRYFCIATVHLSQFIARAKSSVPRY
ncbi:hypothetical protein B0H13DRAFT_1856020 [Mycena leptocephala]|nr:hypothetical protein B0H13DRAFT_1856020 [Mycena leptocephala]